MKHAPMPATTGNTDVHEAAGRALYLRLMAEADANIAAALSGPEEMAVIVDTIAGHLLDDIAFGLLMNALAGPVE